MPRYATFDAYTASLDHLVTIGLPESERVRAAWLAGGGHGPVPEPVSASPYLYDRLEAAFTLARAVH